MDGRCHNNCLTKDLNWLWNQNLQYSNKHCFLNLMCLAFFEMFNDKYPDEQLILEVDLHYPCEFHYRDYGYQIAPKNMQIDINIFSEKQLQLQLKYYEAEKPISTKLICSFIEKKYVIYLPLLLFYIKRGIQVKKLHRVIKFKARNILKEYIEYNATRRKLHKADKTKKYFYKLIHNAPFGKTIENVTKRNTFKLLTKRDKVIKKVSKQHCTAFRYFSKSLFAVQLRKVNLSIKKPFQVYFF